MSSLTSLGFPKRFSRLALLAALGAAIIPSGARAQASTAYTACTVGLLDNCALIQLSSGIGMSGVDFFEIAIRNLGSQTTPSLATTIYSLIFETGQASNPSAVDVSISPKGINGSSVPPTTNWDLFDGGDAIFLSALDNHGVGGCVAGSDVDDGSGNVFGQAGQTCGNGFQLFRFSTATLYNPLAFTLTDLEVTGLTGSLPTDSCSSPTTCLITPTPEPSSVVLALIGFSALGGWRLRRRRAVS